MTWLGRISQQRTQALGQAPAAKKANAAKADPAQFADALVSDKVIKRFGAALAPAAGDMQAIAGAVHGLEKHRAAQFANAVDQFYSSLGRSTSHLVGAKRDAVVTASVSAMRQLVDGHGTHPALMPAMAALSSLLEPRGEHDVPPAKHAAAAQATIFDLVQRSEARLGTTSMLFAFRNLVESCESNVDDLKASQRPETWAKVSDYLAEVVPREGCDQGELGRVSGLVHRALRAKPGHPDEALQLARTQALAPLADAKAATLQQLEVMPANVPAGGPAAEAYGAMIEALAKVVADNPAGPEALLHSIDQLQGKLHQAVAGANNEELVNGYRQLAGLLEKIGPTSAARVVLDHVAQQLPNLIANVKSREILARAGRIQKPESLAPLLVEAHLAQIHRDPNQIGLAGALDKLKRLPAGPSLRAAMTLLPHLPQAYGGPLAEALFVESRTSESAEALGEFARRFVVVHPQLAALGDQAGTVATAMAADTSRAPDANLAAQARQIVQQVKAILPNVPIDQLLSRGRNDEPGLLGLTNLADFIHDPKPIVYALLKKVAARPGTGVAEARLAIHMGAEIGRFDRVPQQTDLPKILEDFEAALADPKILNRAKGARLPGAAAKSVPAFIAAHADLPVEVALTAARALSPSQMTWLRDTLASSRSHAYKRVLRDVLYAAVKTDRADFIDALAQSPAERKIIEGAATMVALEHRQGHADKVPFDRLIEGLKKGEDPVAAIEAERAGAAMKGVGLGGGGKVDPEGARILERAKPQLDALLGFFNQAQYGKPPEYFLGPLKAAVQAQADGTWPAPKYESEAAKEHLAPLSDHQLEAWKRNTVTAKGAAPVAAADDQETIEAIQLLRGVAATLSKNVEIGGRGFKDVKWNKTSLKQLTKQRDELLTQIRNGAKGSKAHRERTRKIGPLQQRVALLELHLALQENFKGKNGPAVSQGALAQIKPLALAALGPLRKQGAHGFVDALQTAAYAIKDVAADSPRQGKYACDDDTLDAYLTAFGGGCIHPSNGFNRGSLVELIGGSQYKMIRAMNGDKPMGRSFLRLVRVQMANGYKGMALRMDPPQASSAGNPGNDDKAMMYEHALTKATSMGVPLLVSDNTVQAAAQARGLKLEAGQNTKVFVHRGVTGMHHNQGMWNADYFICWPGVNVGQGGPRPTEAEKECERDYSFTVVMPAGWK